MINARTEVPHDRRGRMLRDLRISVMDRCNFRCPYCMPESKYGEHFQFLAADERLSFDEIERVASCAASLGVHKLRITGGEPLLRPHLPELIRRLAAIPGIDDIALTTNGLLLPKQAIELRAAGLHRVTISLDSLKPDLFQRMSGGKGDLSAVLAGIDAAEAAGFPAGIKLNMVVQRGVNDSEVLSMADYFRHRGQTLRFIEFMDVGNRNAWQLQQVVPTRELIQQIQAHWPIEPVHPNQASDVATRWRYLDGGGEVGFISAVSAPFCGDCTRARLSSDGRFYTCLFAREGIDLRSPLRAGCNDAELSQLISQRWRQRDDRYSELRQRVIPAADANEQKIEMHYIGG